MSPLQIPFPDLVGLLALLAFVLGPGVVAAALWAPFLAAERIRSLFRCLPPGGSLLSSYLAVTVAASLPYVLGFYWAFATTSEGEAVDTANAILDVIVTVSFAYVLGIPILAGVVLPRAGIDWDPRSYGASTWALLVFGTLWYVAVFAVPLFVFAVFAAMPMG